MMKIQTKPMQTGRLSSVRPQAPADEPSQLASGTPVSTLVAQVYESAPGVEQGRLLEHLLKPLSLLSLAAVANGVFADMLFRSGSQLMHIRPEDAQKVRLDDVIALVDHVQQVSIESVESLAHMFTSCSMMKDSVDAALLVSMLGQRTRIRCERRNCA